MVHKVGLAPGPKPRRGPNRTTIVDLSPYSRPDRRTARARSSRTTTGHNALKRPLNVLQWNADGILKKKVPLSKLLCDEQIDIACIQETHLKPKHDYAIRGYDAVRLDRKTYKGGVLILIRSSLPSRGLIDPTNRESEIAGADITIDGDRTLRVYNVYCPPKKSLALESMEITNANCLVVGDFNSHSDRWGYATTDLRGAELEDWEIDENLHLINKHDDAPTFY
jgi:hypothetical protein